MDQFATKAQALVPQQDRLHRRSLWRTDSFARLALAIPPSQSTGIARLSTAILVTMLLLSSVGCQSWMKYKKKEQFEKDLERARELLADPDRPRLIGEVATASGVNPNLYHGIGLVANLPGTGGIVRPSTQREMMISEMRRNDITNPDEIIDSPSTATTKVRLITRPCDEAGDWMDIWVECSDECTATDLREGHLLPTYLREYQVHNGRNHVSNDKAKASGDLVFVPASLTEGNQAQPLQGRIIQGAKLLETHKLALRVTKDYRHVIIVKAMEKAINKRFYIKEASKMKFVAAGKSDWLIELKTVPKYKLDPSHYMSTILATGYYESDEEVAERVEGCRALLHDRETARRAACELEAIGTKAAAQVLIGGLADKDVEVRFHAAYSLAYLDNPESVPALCDIARFNAAFRPLCLIGLSINECPEARRALDELLQEPEPELRYGALWAIRHRDPRDPVIAGEPVGEAFTFVKIPSQIPLVAVSLENKKEVVLFGGNAVVQLVKEIAPTPSLRMAPTSSGMIRMAKRHATGDVMQAVVTSDLVSIVRGMLTIEANYNDIVQILDELGRTNQISIPVAMNPRPKAGRLHTREEEQSLPAESEGEEEGLEATEILMVDNTTRGESKKSSWYDFASWVKSVGGKPKPSEEFQSLVEEGKALSNEAEKADSKNSKNQ